MALTDTQPLLYPFSGEFLDLTSGRNSLINASGERVSMIMTAPHTGSISAIGFRTGAVASADDLDIRIETVTKTTATTYEPTGTLWGTTTNGTIVAASISANAWHTVSLTSSASMTIGDIFAVVIQFTSDTTVAGSVEIQARGNGIHYFPKVQLRTGGTWATDINSWPCVGLSYSGTYYPTMNGNCWTTTSVTTMTSGAEWGVKFTLPFDCQLLGVAIETRMATGTSFTVELYTTQNPGSGTELKVAAETITTSNGVQLYHLASPTTLTRSTSYRLTVDPTTSVSSNPIRGVYDSTALMVQDVGANWHYTYDNGAGGWTDTTTEVPLYFQLIIGQVNDTSGSGGGLLTHPGMSGGARG